ncbi:hypothetical protein BJ508DRAFT_327769 [Ascobolus immersus RN42]|uniref:Uncharacterized protein n=1 Tax=Ascobolus immersus RN42 TaxID=1160509 RepID=A0A3N4I5G4_ASCIM|nr:hypothetical protein BJ508DRAFT_332151 [Ascobolus immersus RN42]RPA79908.1 hypothetical protein BJ508DRAFT_327769 [Ascobolus immersus RN42]
MKIFRRFIANPQQHPATNGNQRAKEQQSERDVNAGGKRKRNRRHKRKESNKMSDYRADTAEAEFNDLSPHDSELMDDEEYAIWVQEEEERKQKEAKEQQERDQRRRQLLAAAKERKEKAAKEAAEKRRMEEEKAQEAERVRVQAEKEKTEKVAAHVAKMRAAAAGKASTQAVGGSQYAGGKRPLSEEFGERRFALQGNFLALLMFANTVVEEGLLCDEIEGWTERLRGICGMPVEKTASAPGGFGKTASQVDLTKENTASAARPAKRPMFPGFNLQRPTASRVSQGFGTQ